jgi:DnaJ-class molecular chaperone
MKEKCPTCGGSGKIPVPVDDRYLGAIVDWKPCPECTGRKESDD